MNVYTKKLKDYQIKYIAYLYSPNYKDISYSHEKDGSIQLNIVDNKGRAEMYFIYDYDIEVVDWIGEEESLLRQFRHKMYTWFGEKYSYYYLMEN